MVRLIVVQLLAAPDMSKQAFAQSIISKLAGAIGTDGSSFTTGSASIAMTTVATAITEYIIANTTVTVAYVGTLTSTPPAPDPVTTDTFQIIGTCAPTGPSNSFDDWIRQIEANIIAGFQLAPLGTAGVAFVQKPFLNPGVPTTQSMLKAIHDISDENPQQKVWEVVCGGIMDWINGIAMNTTPGPAARTSGPSTGTATITKITIT